MMLTKNGKSVDQQGITMKEWEDPNLRDSIIELKAEFKNQAAPQNYVKRENILD